MMKSGRLLVRGVDDRDDSAPPKDQRRSRPATVTGMPQTFARTHRNDAIRFSRGRAARYKTIVRNILAPADVLLDGNRPWDIRINDDRFYRRVLSGGSLGLGESYMDGWWECEKLDDFFCRLIPTRPEERLKKNWKSIVHVLGAVAIDRSSRARAFQVGQKHYDLGNGLYRNMLDRRMIYSCAYWTGADDLDRAQEAKLDLICRKLNLRRDDRILDIGCGWGGFAAYAAEHYGADVVGITVSKEQAELAKERCKDLPVEIRLQDYRDVRERFDHIVSVGMFEHVGYKNYPAYMTCVHRCLKDDGLFLLHTIGKHETQKANDPWLERYIFPNSLIPSLKQIGVSIENLFVVEDWHNIGTDYDRTLMTWFQNFDANWGSMKTSFDDRFYRMWKYYLLSCAAAFRCRHLQVWQFVLSKHGLPGGYCSVR